MKNRPEEAEQLLLWALMLCKSNFFGSKEHAKCLESVGGLYAEYGRAAEAAEMFEAALHLYAQLGALSEAEVCKSALAILRQ